jgi:uncharacterized protein with HEPN domain
VTSDEALHDLVDILKQLRQIFPREKETWNREIMVQLAVERLWITAGNLAEEYRIQKGIAVGVEPWSELIGFRHLLAHALPQDLSSDRVFADTASDLGRILDQVLKLAN